MCSMYENGSKPENKKNLFGQQRLPLNQVSKITPIQKQKSGMIIFADCLDDLNKDLKEPTTTFKTFVYISTCISSLVKKPRCIVGIVGTRFAIGIPASDLKKNTSFQVDRIFWTFSLDFKRNRGMFVYFRKGLHLTHTAYSRRQKRPRVTSVWVTRRCAFVSLFLLSLGLGPERNVKT